MGIKFVDKEMQEDFDNILKKRKRIKTVINTIKEMKNKRKYKR
jgi:hypothetical protein